MNKWNRTIWKAFLFSVWYSSICLNPTCIGLTEYIIKENRFENQIIQIKESETENIEYFITKL